MPFNKFVEPDFPHIVEIIVPKTGKSGKLDAMNDFHVRHSIKPHRTHGRYKDGWRYSCWCFADRETAEAFATKFAKEGRTSRYKRRAGVREVEKCFPDFVETDVPLGGFGNRLDAMYEFHTRHGVRAINSTGRRGENGRYYVRWCFADPALAEASQVSSDRPRMKTG